MGYTTYFTGEFMVDPPLDIHQRAYLHKFANTRRMKRDPSKLPRDPFARAVGLSHGVDGEFFVGGDGYRGQNKADGSIVDYNLPPSTQPGLWCQWITSEDGSTITWDEREKFYNYVEWIQYIVENFIKPWGRTLNGSVSWSGERDDDKGIIRITDNKVEVATVNISYNEFEEA